MLVAAAACCAAVLAALRLSRPVVRAAARVWSTGRSSASTVATDGCFAAIELVVDELPPPLVPTSTPIPAATTAATSIAATAARQPADGSAGAAVGSSGKRWRRPGRRIVVW